MALKLRVTSFQAEHNDFHFKNPFTFFMFHLCYLPDTGLGYKICENLSQESQVVYFYSYLVDPFDKAGVLDLLESFYLTP